MVEGQTASFFGFFKKFGGWLFFIIYFIANIVSSLFTLIKTGNAKSLLENTLGKILVSDATILKNVRLLQTPSLSEDMQSLLISETIIMFLLLLVVILLFYKLYFNFGYIPGYVAIVFAIMSVFVLEVIYGFVISGFKDPIIGFQGLFELGKCVATGCFENLGTQVVIPINETIG